MKNILKFSILFAFFLCILTVIVPNQNAFADSTCNTVITPISRIAGTDRYATAVQISQAGWADHSSPYAVLSAGMDQNLVDALTAAPLAKLKNAPILLTQGNKLNDDSKAELQRLGVKTVYVTSGVGVITPPVLDELKAMNIKVIPLGGADRFATALNIAKIVGMNGKLVVASAHSNADALSIDAIAAAQGIPILLTETDKLPEKVAAYLDSVKSDIKQTYIIGGTGVINTTVENSLPHPVRLGGENRYATNQLVISAFDSTLQGDSVYVANGENSHLVDALTGSLLAAKSSAAIVLMSDPIQGNTRKFLSGLYQVKEVVAFGGDSVVSQSDLEDAFTHISYSKNGITIGAANSANPDKLKNSLLIEGDNLTLQNVTEDCSVYIRGDNATLHNVNIKGTLFINPGDNGRLNLVHVSASQIVVLSGAEEGIRLEDVKVDTLRISGTSKIDIVPKGNSTISNAIVSSDALLDATQGTWGCVNIMNTVSPETLVELKGSFSHDLFVVNGATLQALENTTVKKVLVMPQAKGLITLNGTFDLVQIEGPAQLSLASTAVVKHLVTHAQTDLNIEKGGMIGHLYNGQFGTLTGDGAQDLPSADMNDPYPVFNPLMSQTLNPALKITSPQEGAVLADGTATITWTAAPGATGYTVEVIDLTTLNIYAKKVPAGTQSFTLPTGHFTKGQRYAIRVKINLPIDPDMGYYIPMSMPPVHVQIGQSAPALTLISPSPNAVYSFGKPIILRWNDPPDKPWNLYTYVFIRGPQGASGFYCSNGTDISPYVRVGQNHISVSMYQGPETLYQGFVDITMIPSSPVTETPDILSPGNGDTIDPNHPLTITWKPVRGAVDYTIRVSKEGDERVKSYDAGTLTSFQLNPLTDGKYHIYIRAVVDNVDRDGNKILISAPKADPSVPSVVPPPAVNIIPVQIVSPTNQAVFSGNEPVILKWVKPKDSAHLPATVKITSSWSRSQGYSNGENINREMQPGVRTLAPGVNHITVTLGGPGNISYYQGSIDIYYNP